MTDRKMESPRGTGSVQQIQEELAYLRHKCNSLMMRGDYGECIKVIESNLGMLYTQERELENFAAMLAMLQKCYPSLNRSQPFEEYAAKLLEKNGVPKVFAKLMRGGGKTVVWSSDYFRELAISCKNSEDYEEALDYCDLALKGEPSSSNLSLLRGWILEDLGKSGQAIEMYQQALELNKTNYQASNSLIRHYVEQDPRKALAYVEEALQAFPEEAGFYATRALVHLKLGERKAAMSDYDLAIALAPNNADYPFEKAELLAEDGLDGPAITLYEKALEANSHHVPALMKLAQLSAPKDPDQALEYVNAVLGREPHNVTAQLLRGELYRRTGDISGAQRQYRRILKDNPESLEALEGLGQLLLKEDPDQALELFGRVLGLNASSLPSRLGKAKAHELIGDPAGAIQEYKTVLQMDKRNAQACAQLGLLYQEEKLQTALEYMNKACALAPDNAYYQADRAMILSRMPGKEQEALKCMNHATDMDAANPELHVKLADMLDAAGNRASAIRHYQQAVHLNTHMSGAHYGLACLQIDREPQHALVHISEAIHLDGVNGEYYYVKAKVLSALARNDKLADLLAEAKELEEKAGNAEMAEEIATMQGGETLRVALVYVNRAIELVPTNTSYVCMRAELLCQLGQRVNAIIQYEELLKMDPQNHEALFGIGRVLAEQKDKKALDYIDKAIRLAPAVARYHGGRAALLAAEPERVAEAIASYGTAAELDHNNWEYQLERGKLMDEGGDYLGAQGCYRKALLIHRGCLAAAARMGELLADKKLHAAMSYTDHAIGLDPENPRFHAQKACLLYRLDEESAAQRETDLALELGNGDWQIYLQLARGMWEYKPQIALEYALAAFGQKADAETCALCGHIYRALGEEQKVWQYYEKAVQLAPGYHEVQEEMIGLLYARRDPGCMEALDALLEQEQGCAVCHYLKTLMLDELEEDLPAALEWAEKTVQLAPGEVLYREKLVELLKRKGSILRHFRENRKLEKLRRQRREAEQQEAQTDEISFDQEDQEDQ